MNSFPVKITSVQTTDSLSLVSLVTASGNLLKTVVIDTPQSNTHLKTGNPVQATFKETEVALSLEPEPSISLRNRIHGEIAEIEKGQILSRVTVNTSDGEVVSVISTEAVTELNLLTGVSVTCLIKLNEIALAYD